MSVGDEAVLCIEAEGDTSFLWDDIKIPGVVRSQSAPALSKPSSTSRMGKGGHDRFCPVCEERIFTRLKRHVEREHLPWWFSLMKCWSCKQSVTSACFLRKKHKHCNHSIPQLNSWIWKANGLLHALAKYLNLPFLELVRNHVAAQREWYPWDQGDCTLSFEQRIVMRMWEAGNRLNLSNIDSLTITPPASVACLLHWKVMACILQHLPFEIRQQIKSSDVECDYSGDPVHLRCLPALGQMVDSHCHLDILFKRYRVDGLSTLIDKVKPALDLHYVVGNYRK